MSSIANAGATCWLHAAVIAGGLAGCAMDDGEDTGTIESELSVSAFTSSGCSTSVVLGLSRQIADEIGCMNPGALVEFTPTTRLTVSSNAVLPYLHGTAKTDLESVAASRTVQVNSAFRTVAQQYLLYKWYQAGRCGISAAASPGRSNHESGRALDVANYSSLISAMSSRGWAHNVPGDPVHFEHLSSPDNRGKDVLAFQRLWNRNNPGDRIAEDGAYGPQTEARLRASPATGFATGATCTPRLAGADVVMIEGPDKLAPGAKSRYAITVTNRGTTDWPATTRIIVAGGGTSDLYDASTWVSPSEVGTLAADIGAGAQGVIEIPVVAPNVTDETAVFTQLTLDDGGTAMGTINLAVTITPNGDEDTSGDADDQHDELGEIEAGCNAGGGSSLFALLAPALLVLRRRRRA